jgi:hypothetical protein
MRIAARITCVSARAWDGEVGHLPAAREGAGRSGAVEAGNGNGVSGFWTDGVSSGVEVQVDAVKRAGERSGVAGTEGGAGPEGLETGRRVGVDWSIVILIGRLASAMRNRSESLCLRGGGLSM